MYVFEMSRTCDCRNGGTLSSLLFFESAESVRSSLRVVILMRYFDLQTGFLHCHCLGSNRKLFIAFALHYYYLCQDTYAATL